MKLDKETVKTIRDAVKDFGEDPLVKRLQILNPGGINRTLLKLACDDYDLFVEADVDLLTRFANSLWGEQSPAPIMIKHVNLSATAKRVKYTTKLKSEAIQEILTVPAIAALPNVRIAQFAGCDPRTVKRARNKVVGKSPEPRAQILNLLKQIEGRL